MVLIMIIAAICFAFRPIIVHCEKDLNIIIIVPFAAFNGNGSVDSPGLVDFTIGFANSVLSMPDGFLGSSDYRRTLMNTAHHKCFSG